MKKTPKKYIGSSPMKFVQFLPAAISIGSSLLGARSASRRRKAEEREKARNMGLFNEQLEAYKSEIYENPYENLESFTEDMRVDTTAADYQAAQQRQQAADIMQGIGQTVGGAGAAALAASMSRQGAIQAQQAAAGIQSQEARIKNMQLQEARQMQQQKIAGEQQVLGLERARRENIAGMYGTMAAGNIQNIDALRAEQNQALTSAVTTAAQGFMPGGGFSGGEFGIDEYRDYASNAGTDPYSFSDWRNLNKGNI